MTEYDMNLFATSAPPIVCEKSVEYSLSAKRKESTVVKLSSSDLSEKYARQFYEDDIAIYESAFIILLNQAMNTIGWAKIAQGGVAATVVDVRLIAKFAIDSLATGVIFVHNHPSGQLQPSLQDISLVNKIKNGLNLLDIKLCDAIIIIPGSGRYSFSDNGRL
jgi:DNA repair protein RadC